MAAESAARAAESRKAEAMQRMAQLELNLNAVRDALEKQVADRDHELTELRRDADAQRTRATEAERALASTNAALFQTDELVRALKASQDKMHTQHKQTVATLTADAQAAARAAAEELSAVQTDAAATHAALTSRAEELQVLLDDTLAQQRITDKKRLHLVKELKAQLRREAMVNRDLQVTLNAVRDELDANSLTRLDAYAATQRRQFLSPGGNGRGHSTAPTPFTSPLPPAQGATVAAVMNSPMPRGGGGPTIEVESEVAAALTDRLAQVQEMNFTLKQRIKYLEETVQVGFVHFSLHPHHCNTFSLTLWWCVVARPLQTLSHDLEQKRQIVQSYVRRVESGALSVGHPTTTTFTSSRSNQFAESPDDVKRDMYAKMELLLEETSLHNVQLRKVVDTLGHELQRLDSECKAAVHEAATAKAALQLADADKAELTSGLEVSMADATTAQQQVVTVTLALRRLEGVVAEGEAERRTLHTQWYTASAAVQRLEAMVARGDAERARLEAARDELSAQLVTLSTERQQGLRTNAKDGPTANSDLPQQRTATTSPSPSPPHETRHARAASIAVAPVPDSADLAEASGVPALSVVPALPSSPVISAAPVPAPAPSLEPAPGALEVAVAVSPLPTPSPCEPETDADGVTPVPATIPASATAATAAATTPDLDSAAPQAVESVASAAAPATPAAVHEALAPPNVVTPDLPVTEAAAPVEVAPAKKKKGKK